MRDLAISEMGGEVYLQRQAQTMVGQPADPIPPNPYANTYSGGPSSFLNRNRKKGSDSSSEAKNTTTARESTVKESMSSMDRLKQYLNSQ
ncbi:hypothetical protein ADEAN_000248300 [Angomonas deanei]|uniref:Uncharacterized protein n=1 Tax=Angomonas deanei TaxID=59799 RepID=A0A7G2C5M4_9TRYP|nr:hypothetical protein ADEAN_000248300 [Angomonas deanei]